MDKKVKLLDLTILLSLMLYIACIAFVVMGFIFLKQQNADRLIFEYTNGTDKRQDNIFVASIILIVGFVFGGLAVITGTICGISYMCSNWGDPSITKMSKILGGLNLIPICLSIPGNILTKKLINEFVHEGKKTKKKNKNAEENKTPASDIKPNTGVPVQPQPQATKFVAPINEVFQYNGKWMYFDGQNYFETDANNQWVASTTIPQ